MGVRCTIPVRGRKRIDIMKPPKAFRTIPVRGRKHVRVTGVHGIVRTIPVRGRKRSYIWFIFFRSRTIPVRGRKHARPPGIGRMWEYYPRKGAKTSRYMRCPSPDMYHPRKGTKNSASKKMRSFSFANLNFLFSVGCSSMNGTIAAAVIFSLLRLLHSDKMCYNKANSKHLSQNQQIHFPFIVQFFHDP